MDSSTKKLDVAYAEKSEHEVNPLSESLHQVHVHSKNSKSIDKKHTSILRSSRRHQNYNVRQNTEIQGLSSSESSSSVDSSFILDSYVIEQRFGKDKTANDSMIYTGSHPVKSSIPFSVSLPESASQVTDERGAFETSASYSQCRKEPMGSENISPPFTVSKKEKSKFPSSYAKQHMSTIQGTETHSKNQNSLSGNSKFETSVSSQQYISPSSCTVGQYARPPLIGQSSDILFQSGIKQSTSESSESVTSNTSLESRDSLTYKVESLIGERITRNKIQHSNLSTLLSASDKIPLQGKLSEREIRSLILGGDQKKSVLVQKNCGLFSQDMSHHKREFSDAAQSQIILPMADVSGNHMVVHSQLSRQEQMAAYPGEFSGSCRKGFAEKTGLKHSFPKSAHAIQCTEQVCRSLVSEPGVVTEHSSSVLSNKPLSEEDELSSSKEESLYPASGEYSSSDKEKGVSNTPPLVTNVCSVKQPASSCLPPQQLFGYLSSDQDFAQLCHDAESSKCVIFSSTVAHSDGVVSTDLLGLPTALKPATERTKQSADLPMLKGTDTMLRDQLIASSNSLEMSSRTSVSLGVLTSSPESFLIHSTYSKPICASRTSTHSSGVLPVIISSSESLPVSSSLSNVNNNVQSSVSLSSHSTPSHHQSANSTFPPSSYVGTVVPNRQLLTVSSDINLMSSSPSPITVSNMRSIVTDTSSSDYMKKGNNSVSSTVPTSTCAATGFSNGLSAAAVPLTYGISVSDEALVFTGSLSDSSVEPSLVASSSSVHKTSASHASASDSENVVKRSLGKRHRLQNEPFSNQHVKNKFHTYSVYSFPGVIRSSEHPLSPGKKNRIIQNNPVSSSTLETSTVENISSKSDNDFDEHNFHNLKRQVTGSSYSSSSSSSGSHNSTLSPKSLSDQEAERSISEITVSAESIQTIISVSRKSSNADTEAEVSDESKNVCKYAHEEDAHTSSVKGNKNLAVKICTSITGTESQYHNTCVSPGLGPQLSNHDDQTRKYQIQRHGAVHRNEVNIDESEKSEYQSDHPESPMSVSSLASSKRLEWDNGADIGYETAPGMLSNLERLKPSDFALLFRSDPEGGALSNKKKTPSLYQQVNTHNQLVTSDSTASVTPVENPLHSLSHSVVFAIPSTPDEKISKKKNEQRLSGNTSDDPSSSAKHSFQPHLMYISKGSNFYDICVQTEPKYFTKEAGVQAKLSLQSEGSLSSSYGSTSSGNTVKMPAKNKRHRLRHTAALASSESGRTEFHLHTAGEHSHQCDPNHEVLKEAESFSVHRDPANSPLSEASFSVGALLEENATDQHFEQNAENSENSSEEESVLYDAHTKYFTDISNLQLQFPYPQQFLPSNISSVLVFDENSAYPEFLPDGADISELGDRVVFLRSSDHEQLLLDQTDGPHIRWYPVSGRSNSQEIRDAATQTAVSYIAEHDPEIYVDSQSEQSQMNNSSNTISSTQVSECESLDYPSCNQSVVRKYSDSGKENILPLDIQHSHYMTSESHIVPCEMRSDSIPRLLKPGESPKIFNHRPQSSEETVPKSLTFSSPSAQGKISSATEKNSKNAYFVMNQNSKFLPQSCDALPQYEFQTLNYGDSSQSKNYESEIRGTVQTSFHHPLTATRVMSDHVAHGYSASNWNSTHKVPNEITVSDTVPPSEALQFQSERPVENIHHKVLKFLPKGKVCNDYGDTVTCQNTPIYFSQTGNGQNSELASSPLGQTQASAKRPSCDNHMKQKESEKSKETLKSVSESIQKSNSINPPAVPHSLDETPHFHYISDGYPYHNYVGKNHFMYLPDERREDQRSLHSNKTEKLPHKRIGGVGGNVPLADQSQFATKFSTSANLPPVTAYTDSVSHVPLRHAGFEEVKTGTDLISDLHSKEAVVLREGTLDMQTDMESNALTSMSQSETAESMHTGSEDAVPPKFPPEVLGSRREPVVSSPGIYGNRKFSQKYGHQGLRKFPSDSNLYDSRYSSNYNLYVSRPLDVASHAGKGSGVVNIGEKTVQPSSDVNISHNTSSEPKTEVTNELDLKQEVNEKNVDNVKNPSLRQDVQATQYQANSAQNQHADIPHDNVVESSLSGKSESSDIATVSISSESHLSHEKNEDLARNNMPPSDDPTRDLKDSCRITSEPKSQVVQKAKVEIGKLENLINRQKKNYLRRLQLEIERLTRLEDLVIKHTSKRTSVSNSSLSSNGNAEQTIPKYVSSDVLNKVIQQLDQPQNPVISYESETSESSFANVSHAKNSKMSSSIIPKQRNVKIQVSLGDMVKKQCETTTSSKSRTKDNLGNGYIQMKDFGQNYPAPVSSDHGSAQVKSSGIQTSDSLLDVEGHSKSEGEKVRLFISLEGAQKKEKSKKPGSSKLAWIPKVSKSNPKTRIEVPSSIAWNVSHRKSSNRRWKHTGAHSHDISSLSLQDAFHRNCGHLIRRSQARLMRITKLAELRSRLTSLALEKARFGQASNYRIACLKHAMYPLRRHFTHKEIRLQTERIYKKLPEVVELKEKKKREEMYRTNRLMAEIYKKKLQEQVLKGKVNWTISQTCLTA